MSECLISNGLAILHKKCCNFKTAHFEIITVKVVFLIILWFNVTQYSKVPIKH